MNDQPSTYTFYADCHGLQSLIPINVSEFGVMSIMCQSNIQRFCVWGTIKLDKEIYVGLLELMKDEQGSKEALELIKNTKYNLPQKHMQQYKKFLDKIPNDELDPMWDKGS